VTRLFTCPSAIHANAESFLLQRAGLRVLELNGWLHGAVRCSALLGPEVIS
jgi:hypothetical protein